MKITHGRIIIILIAVLILVLIALVFFSTANDNKYVNIKIGSLELKAYLACTEKEQEKGLGDRSSISNSDAMLFVFSEPSSRTFWMKDMLFPIDLLWLDSSGRVVGFENNMPPPTTSNLDELRSYPSPGAVSYVLEGNASLIEMSGVSKGSLVVFSNLPNCK